MDPGAGARPSGTVSAPSREVPKVPSPSAFPPHPASAEALFRYTVVSQVLARELRSEPRASAVAAVADRPHRTVSGRLRTVGRRTLYRWLQLWSRGGFEALEPRPRPRTPASQVLPEALLAFVRAEKARDPFASLPELLRRALELGLVAEDAAVDRVTLWRACGRMGLDVRRRKATRARDVRRFAYPNRMQMVLCDGKHFRAGASRARRVVLFFLDDATRLGLNAVVGTTETSTLFLRGLYGVLRQHGKMDLLYFDGGTGFQAADSLRALGRLAVHPVHGEAEYPPGRGAVERFNQTAKAAVLRNLDRRADVDPACGALELRLQHYLRERYNHTPHESLYGLTPWQKWDADPRPLVFPFTETELRDRFVVHEERRVSADNVVMVKDVPYEVPRGHASLRIVVQRRLLEGTVAVLHDGRWTVLDEVDLAQNAVSGRARKGPPPEPEHPLPPTAAERAFQRDFHPVVGPDGGFPASEEEP